MDHHDLCRRGGLARVFGDCRAVDICVFGQDRMGIDILAIRGRGHGCILVSNAFWRGVT